MGHKWIWGSIVLLLTSFLLIGGILPVDKGIQALFQFSSDNIQDNETKTRLASKQPPALSGQIQNVTGDQIIVVEPTRNGHAEVKGYVRIKKETRIFRKVKADFIDAKPEDLQAGMNVSVWQDGPILMIYPAQLTADELVIEKKEESR